MLLCCAHNPQRYSLAPHTACRLPQSSYAARCRKLTARSHSRTLHAGDIYPATIVETVIAMGIICVGLIFFGLLLGSIASSLQVRESPDKLQELLTAVVSHSESTHRLHDEQT